MFKLIKSIFLGHGKVNFFLISFILFFCSTFVFAEDITITTYYPSPYGSYDQLGTNKLAVDITGVAVPSEFTAMANGDAHIGRALIVGAGGGSGFAFDEGAAPTDGTLLVKSRLGIGTTNAAGSLLVIRSSSAGSVVNVQDVSGFARVVLGLTAGLGGYINLSNAAGSAVINLNAETGRVGIGVAAPTQSLDVSGTINATAYSVGGVVGFNGTKTVLQSCTAVGVCTTCTIIITNGIITGGTC